MLKDEMSDLSGQSKFAGFREQEKTLQGRKEIEQASVSSFIQRQMESEGQHYFRGRSRAVKELTAGVPESTLISAQAPVMMFREKKPAENKRERSRG